MAVSETVTGEGLIDNTPTVATSRYSDMMVIATGGEMALTGGAWWYKASSAATASQQRCGLAVLPNQRCSRIAGVGLDGNGRL